MKFPQKLWEIVNSCETDAIRWSEKGSTILIDYSRFQDQYLSSGNSTFKTRNINSFVRQLNLYGFRKVTSIHRDPVWNLQNPNIHEFYHKDFSATTHLLVNVVRKAKHSKKLTHLKTVHRMSPDKENTFSEISSNLLSEKKNIGSVTGKYFASWDLNKSEEIYFLDPSELSNKRLAVARNALRKALEDATTKSKPIMSSDVKEEYYDDNETALSVFVSGEESLELIVPDMPSDTCVNWEEKSSFPMLLNADDPTFQISTTATTFDKQQVADGWTAEDMPLPPDFTYNDFGQHAELLLQNSDHHLLYDKINFPNDTEANDQQFGQNNSNTTAQNFMDLINDLPPSTLRQ